MGYCRAYSFHKRTISHSCLTLLSMLNILNNIQLEMQIIQLQLHLAKRCTHQQKSLSEVQTHINHSLHSLNHLISQIDDFKTKVELQYSASYPTKETLCKT